MSTTTTNYGLVKPERSDNYNVDVMGNNMDIIDTKLKEYNNAINGGNIKGNLTGNVTGNVTGKINVSNCATSGDTLVFVVSFNNPSTSSLACTSTNTSTLNAGTVTKKNTGIINYTGSTTVSNTCKITVSYSTTATTKLKGRFYLTIVNNTTGATVVSNEYLSPTDYSTGSSWVNCPDYSFTRASNNTYTVTVRPHNRIRDNGTTSDFASVDTYKVAFTTANVSRYVP